MSFQNGYTRSTGRVLPRLARSALNFGLLTALRLGPAGLAGWALKSVSRRPLKFLIAIALEPLLMRLAGWLKTRLNF